MVPNQKWNGASFIMPTTSIARMRPAKYATFNKWKLLTNSYWTKDVIFKNTVYTTDGFSNNILVLSYFSFFFNLNTHTHFIYINTVVCRKVLHSFYLFVFQTFIFLYIYFLHTSLFILKPGFLPLTQLYILYSFHKLLSLIGSL